MLHSLMKILKVTFPHTFANMYFYFILTRLVIQNVHFHDISSFFSKTRIAFYVYMLFFFLRSFFFLISIV